MAGSYNYVVEDDGSLSSNERVAGMLENGGDVYEAVEQMYGMIWLLAHRLKDETGFSPEAYVEEARVHYKEGLNLSPIKQSIEFYRPA